MAVGKTLQLRDARLDDDVRQVLDTTGEQLEGESGKDYVARVRAICQELVGGDSETIDDLFARTLIQRRKLVAVQQREGLQRTLASDRRMADLGRGLDDAILGDGEQSVA
ncbi:hypothetical protein KJ742_04495 [Patescibacteria group bacterium]|nr:hypothetical protein [Patescibacteria group bacterium]MBU1683178.1 hypothetical protein [Patescibacteria group bacterium]MBU1934736.1 hypothetical protein [Patescibacteria group bacterium]